MTRVLTSGPGWAWSFVWSPLPGGSHPAFIYGLEESFWNAPHRFIAGPEIHLLSVPTFPRPWNVSDQSASHWRSHSMSLTGFFSFSKYEEIILGRVLSGRRKRRNMDGTLATNIFIPSSLFPPPSLSLPFVLLPLSYLWRANYLASAGKTARQVTTMAVVSSGCCREMAGKMCEMKMDSSERGRSREVSCGVRLEENWDKHLIRSSRTEVPGSSVENDS